MTGPLVPPELLAALPHPWQLADASRRRRAIDDALATGPEQQAVALRALKACFAYLIEARRREGDEPDWGLPGEFWEYHSFAMDVGLDESLPTLADVTPEKVRAWVEADVEPELAFGTTWTTPPDDVVDNIGRARAFYIVNGLAEDLLRWFRGPARDHLDPSVRARLVALFEEAAPGLPWRLATLVVRAVLEVGGPDEKGYFDRLAGDQDVHAKIRDEAASVSWLIDRQNEPG